MKSSLVRVMISLTIISVALQIVISLIYSNQIIYINNIFSQQRKNIDNLNRTTESLQKQLSQLESIETLNNSSPSGSLSPINKSINLNE